MNLTLQDLAADNTGEDSPYETTPDWLVDEIPLDEPRVVGLVITQWPAE